MKSKWFYPLIIAIAFLVFGCTPKIDASSEDALEASIEKVRDSLDHDEQTAFDKALEVLAFSSIGEAFFNPDASGEELARAFMTTMDGKTAAEIIAEAERVKERVAREEARREQERKERQRQQALAEIEELQERQTAADLARQDLEKFEIRRSRFQMIPQRYGGPVPAIDLEVYNGADHPVSRAYFEGTLATPGRSIPWLEESFNYEIRGGLEPGESAEWSLRPNQFSEWGRVEDRDDMVFTVVPVRLDGPDGEPLFKIDFTERDARRLATLREEYGQ